MHRKMTETALWAHWASNVARPDPRVSFVAHNGIRYSAHRDSFSNSHNSISE